MTVWRRAHGRRGRSAASGKVDKRFWGSIYKWEDAKGSGSPHVSGWILNLFPYLDNRQYKDAHAMVARMGSHPSSKATRDYLDEQLKEPPLLRNPWLGVRGLRRDGPGRDDFPYLPARAPFKWVYLGQVFPMEFVGGLVGVRQEAGSLCLRPEIGWAVLKSAGEAAQGPAGPSEPPDQAKL